MTLYVKAPHVVLPLDKFGDHIHCDSGDITFLICHVTLGDRLLKGIYEFMGGSPSW